MTTKPRDPLAALHKELSDWLGGPSPERKEALAAVLRDRVLPLAQAADIILSLLCERDVGGACIGCFRGGSTGDYGPQGLVHRAGCPVVRLDKALAALTGETP